jgi:hypothetical protein
MSQASDTVGVNFSGSPSESLQESPSSKSPASSHRITIKLDQETSKSIIAASKARGSTVRIVVRAALVTAMRHHSDTPGGRMRGITPFDL